MDRIIFGDNQFFGVNHLSEEKSRAQALRFKDTDSIMEVLNTAYDLGIRTFMCTTYDRISGVCDRIRNDNKRFHDFKIYPCMPYAHKYANSVTENGIIGTLKRFMPGNVVGTFAKGGMALAKQDYISMMELLVDAEMKMFRGLNTEVIFLQNVIVDLLLGLGATDFFIAFSDHVKKQYGAEAGFITMNMPRLYDVLTEAGLEDPIICSSINKMGFRMSGGRECYEKKIADSQCRTIAMQVLAAGAIPPDEAMEYVCSQKNIKSILFGASSAGNIKQSMDLIESFSSR